MISTQTVVGEPVSVAGPALPPHRVAWRWCGCCKMRLFCQGLSRTTGLRIGCAEIRDELEFPPAHRYAYRLAGFCDFSSSELVAEIRSGLCGFTIHRASGARSSSAAQLPRICGIQPNPFIRLGALTCRPLSSLHTQRIFCSLPEEFSVALYGGNGSRPRRFSGEVSAARARRAAVLFATRRCPGVSTGGRRN